MSTLTYAVHDSRTMLRRQLRRAWRYPAMTMVIIAIPVILLLLFVYVFGGTMGAGITGGTGSRADYANYLVPGILLLSIATGATSTATSVAMDMTEGIIARFKTMAIYRPSVLAGHVIGSTTQTMIGLALLIGVGLLVGFRPTATPVEWLAVAGLLVAISVAITWLSVACGLVSKTVEGASNLPMPLILLPFLVSGFVAEAFGWRAAFAAAALGPLAALLISLLALRPIRVAPAARCACHTSCMRTRRGMLTGVGAGCAPRASSPDRTSWDRVF